MYDNPQCYGGYMLKNVEGNLEWLGSSHVEQKHSSVVSALGSGASWKLEDQVHKLLCHQENLQQKKNDKRLKYEMQQCRYPSSGDTGVPGGATTGGATTTWKLQYLPRGVELSSTHRRFWMFLMCNENKNQKHKWCLGSVPTRKRYWTGTDGENRENIKNMKNILEKWKIPRVPTKKLKIVCFVFGFSTLRPPLRPFLTAGIEDSDRQSFTVDGETLWTPVLTIPWWSTGRNPGLLTILDNFHNI
jgi:hypothetical protein